MQPESSMADRPHQSHRLRKIANEIPPVPLGIGLDAQHASACLARVRDSPERRHGTRDGLVVRQRATQTVFGCAEHERPRTQTFGNRCHSGEVLLERRPLLAGSEELKLGPAEQDALQCNDRNSRIGPPCAVAHERARRHHGRRRPVLQRSQLYPRYAALHEHCAHRGVLRGVPGETRDGELDRRGHRARSTATKRWRASITALAPNQYPSRPPTSPACTLRTS